MLDFLHKKDSEKSAQEEHKRAALKQQTEAFVNQSAADK